MRRSPLLHKEKVRIEYIDADMTDWFKLLLDDKATK